MITHGHKQIKEQAPTPLHLRLHGPAPLERRPRPNNQRQIMRPQLTITLRRVRIRIPRTAQYRPTTNPHLQALLPQRQPLQLLQPIPIRRTIHQRILQQILLGALVPDGARGRPRGDVFELPAVLTLVVQEFGVVVAFVEEFEDGGEDFRDFFREGDAFGLGLEELAAGYGGEEGGGGQDGGVGCEEAGGGADGEGQDWGGEVAVVVEDLLSIRMFKTIGVFCLAYLGDAGRSDFDVWAFFSMRREVAAACSLNERWVRLLETLALLLPGRCFEKLSFWW